MDECLRYTQLRVEAALRQLEVMQDRSLQFPDGQEALKRIRSEWVSNVETLKRAPTNSRRISAAHCFKALGDLRYFMPFAGMISRSTAVRNPFELYGPLRLMANTLLERPGAGVTRTPIRLILSSNWDYTPQTTRQLKRLSDFVFIILPGCEASNPLLIPLAGHELGHAVWEREKISVKLEKAYALKVTKFLLDNRAAFPEVKLDGKLDAEKIRERLETEKPKNSTYTEACELVRRQLEEFFCDFVGLYLFGESFLHAFAYFLSPDFPAPRSPKYPTVRIRLEQLSKARTRFAREWGKDIYPKPPDVRELFEERAVDFEEPRTRQQNVQQRRLLEKGIDDIAAAMTNRLLDVIVDLGKRKNWTQLRNFDEATRKKILNQRFRWAVPAEAAGSMANILNAAWDVERDRHFWDNHPSLAGDLDKLEKEDHAKAREIRERRREALYDLALKNLEVLEYEYIISQPLSEPC